MTNIFRLLSLVILLMAIFAFSFAQDTQALEIQSNPAPGNYALLLKSNSELAENTLQNEQVLDLVDMFLTDSILPIKRQRHRVVGSALLPMLGYKWLTINYRKEKFVSTATSNLIVPSLGSDLYTEYDVNWNLSSHLPQYQQLEMEGYGRMKEIGRKPKKNNNYEGEPFTEINDSSNLERYHLHCEHTPLIDYRPMFNQLFFPVIAPLNTVDHPNFMDSRPSIGIYGAFVSDCNHHCHPEIHPYEWIWWLNFAEQADKNPNAKEWLIGLMREGSNRFPKWSPSPRIGEISVPFAFPADKNEWTIQLEHIIFGPFDEEGMQSLDIPAAAFDLNFTEKAFSINHPSLKNKKLLIKTSNPMTTGGLKAWIGELNYDESAGLVTGKIHFAVSVRDLWTARLTTVY